jgi:hypothetical protein
VNNFVTDKIMVASPGFFQPGYLVMHCTFQFLDGY